MNETANLRYFFSFLYFFLSFFLSSPHVYSIIFVLEKKLPLFLICNFAWCTNHRVSIVNHWVELFLDASSQINHFLFPFFSYTRKLNRISISQPKFFKHSHADRIFVGTRESIKYLIVIIESQIKQSGRAKNRRIKISPLVRERPFFFSSSFFFFFLTK